MTLLVTRMVILKGKFHHLNHDDGEEWIHYVERLEN